MNEKRCHCCGKVLRLFESESPEGLDIGTTIYEDALTVEKTWGYFSGKDLMKHRFQVCEACYDAWIATFQIPVCEEETTVVE